MILKKIERMLVKADVWIRPYRRGDNQSIIRVDRECYVIPTQSEDLRYLYEYKNFIGFSAILRGHLVGYIFGSINQDHTEMFRLGVATRHRREGIGTRLFKELYDSSIERGMDRVQTLVSDADTYAHLFLKSLGIDEVRVIKGEIDDEDLVIGDFYRFIKKGKRSEEGSVVR